MAAYDDIIATQAHLEGKYVIYDTDYYYYNGPIAEPKSQMVDMSVFRRANEKIKAIQVQYCADVAILNALHRSYLAQPGSSGVTPADLKENISGLKEAKCLILECHSYIIQNFDNIDESWINEQLAEIQSKLDASRPPGITPEGGEDAHGSGENQIEPSVQGIGQPGPNMGQPLSGLPGKVQAVAPTLVAHQPTLDHPIDGIQPLDGVQEPFQGDLLSILVLPKGGGVETYDSGNTKIEAKLTIESDFLSLSNQGIQESIPKLDDLATMFHVEQSVPKETNNKRKENSSNLYDMINNVEIEPILTSQKLIDYIISCGLRDFKKRKKLSI